jgi:hypothetical protein
MVVIIRTTKDVKLERVTRCREGRRWGEEDGNKYERYEAGVLGTHPRYGCILGIYLTGGSVHRTRVDT